MTLITVNCSTIIGIVCLLCFSGQSVASNCSKPAIDNCKRDMSKLGLAVIFNNTAHCQHKKQCLDNIDCRDSELYSYWQNASNALENDSLCSDSDYDKVMRDYPEFGECSKYLDSSDEMQQCMDAQRRENVSSPSHNELCAYQKCMYELLKTKCDENAARLLVTMIAIVQYAIRNESHEKHDCDIGFNMDDIMAVIAIGKNNGTTDHVTELTTTTKKSGAAKDHSTTSTTCLCLFLLSLVFFVVTSRQ